MSRTLWLSGALSVVLAACGPSDRAVTSTRSSAGNSVA